MIRYKILIVGVLVALLFSVGVDAAARAQRVVSDDEVNQIAKQLYCPVCENISLDVCPTQACSQWRELIREKLAAGETEADIKEYFVLQYGDRVLATPPARGINWLIYLIPPISFVAGAFVLFRAFRSWKQPLPEATPEQVIGEEKDEYIQRMEEELRRR